MDAKRELEWIIIEGWAKGDIKNCVKAILAKLPELVEIDEKEIIRITQRYVRQYMEKVHPDLWEQLATAIASAKPIRAKEGK